MQEFLKEIMKLLMPEDWCVCVSWGWVGLGIQASNTSVKGERINFFWNSKSHQWCVNENGKNQYFLKQHSQLHCKINYPVDIPNLC